MKVLLCHNHYLLSGGEDRVFFDESELLRQHGHEVVHFTVHNKLLKELGPLATTMKLLWNRETARQVRRLIRASKPDIMHCTNIFPLLSPSVYAAAQAEGVPVIQSLHNFRLLCANAAFSRQGTSCQRCLSTPMFPWRAVRHGCYQGSRFRSFAILALLSLHRMTGSWSHGVDRYIVLTENARALFAQHGIPAKKIAIKPNFVSGNPVAGKGPGEYALFIGRLTREKGIEELLGSWKLLADKIPLKIVGAGPLAHIVQRAVAENASIQYLGELSHEEVMMVIRNARILVMPSIGQEPFGMVIIEAYACGRPVIAATPAVAEGMIEVGRTGLHYPSGRPDLLAERVQSLWRSPELCEEMGRNARQAYHQRFTAEENYRLMLSIYQDVLSQGAAKRMKTRKPATVG